MIEKKTIINLIEAFAVSVKHYLRGGESCFIPHLHPFTSCSTLSSSDEPACVIL